MECPYCGQQHLHGTQFCPVTGNRLVIRQNKTSVFFIGLGISSAFLVIFSLIMLFSNRHESATSLTNRDSDIVSEAPLSQEQQSPNNLQNSLLVEPTATLPPTPTPTETMLPIPEPLELKLNVKDGVEIVLIPAGEFLMGSDRVNDPYFWGAEAPQHSVSVDKFWIYRTEVTQRMYHVCDTQDACPAPVVINDPIAKQYGNPRFEDYPVVMVTWQAAAAYCKWAGGRLPREAEWEKAARSTDGRLFPWGSEANADGLANFSSDSPVAVGSYPLGSSPYGVYDMAGNVLEWVNDSFESGYYQYSPLDNPLGPLSGNRKVIRGGAFNHSTVDGLRTVARASLRLTDTKVSVGFRCVIDLP